MYFNMICTHETNKSTCVDVGQISSGRRKHRMHIGLSSSRVDLFYRESLIIALYRYVKAGNIIDFWTFFWVIYLNWFGVKYFCRLDLELRSRSNWIYFFRTTRQQPTNAFQSIITWLIDTAASTQFIYTWSFFFSDMIWRRLRKRRRLRKNHFKENAHIEN